MTIRQVNNTLDLLEFFAQTKKPASLAEIHRHFEWPRSSTYNILSTLVDRGYMYEPSRRGGYYPTPRWLRLAETLTAADQMNEQLSDLLRRVASETGETAIIAAPAGRYSVYLDVIESPSPIRYAGHVGKRIPIHAGASGRALLSLYSPSERQSILCKVSFERYGSNALTSVEAVEHEIRISRNRGWFQSIHEYDADLAAVAIPLTVDERRLAIVVAGPVYRVGEQCGEIATTLRRLVDTNLDLETSD